MTPEAGRHLRFDDFEIDRHTLELRRQGAPVKLQQQPVRVLAHLAEHAGELVSRETLQKAIWGDETFVDFERGLNYCVNQIRVALGDSADSPRYVETLRGRGYRFIGRLEGEAPAPVRFARPLSVAAVALLLGLLGVWALTRSAPAKPLVAIGIAPLSAPADEQSWAAALQTQIVSRLSSRSRTPVIDLAQGAGVNSSTQWRLEGRVDHSTALYRVTLLLRDTRDGSVPWSDVFTGTPGDWIDAQTEMADRMTEIVRYRIEGPSAGLPKRRSRLPDHRPTISETRN
jgi:DNA-binding winged helix-turn-helix (wHTH) protein/TolB-like protein